MPVLPQKTGELSRREIFTAAENYFAELLGPIFMLFHFLISIFMQNLTRRAFLKTGFAGTGAALLALTGCASSGTDRITEWRPYSNARHPRTLNYRLDQYLELMKDYDLDLKRLFLDWISLDVAARLREEAANDPVVTGSIAAVINGLNASPAGGITVSGNPAPSYLPGVFYVDTQTNATTDSNGNTIISNDNITLASRFVAVPAILPTQTRGLDSTPGFYWEIPILGNQTPPAQDLNRLVEVVRKKFKDALALKVNQVQQAYWRLVELKQDLAWLRELSANYASLLQLGEVGEEEKAELRRKQAELTEKISQTEHAIRLAQTELMRKVGFPRDVFTEGENDYFMEVTVEPPETLNLEFDETRLPLFIPRDVEQRILNNSALQYRLEGELTNAEEAIGAMKDKAGQPKVELIMGYAPPEDALVGIRFQFNPLRNRAAEADILNWRIQYANLRTQILSFRTELGYQVRDLDAHRTELLRRVRNKKASHEQALAAAQNIVGKSQPQQLADQAALVEAKRAYLAELRNFNQYESTRFVLEGQMVSDPVVTSVLEAMKQYHYERFMRQDEIWFHGVFSNALRSLVPWLLALIGFGAAASPHEALAQEIARRQDPPSIRWRSPEIPPSLCEPLFASSL